ncbi:MAG: sulfite exporter TauE/SafE family protein [Burkholderiaceae bacterium]
MTAYVLILALGLVAGCVGGVIGTGSSIILLPVLVYTFGPKQAVPIMAVASVMGNLARVIAWHRDVDWRAVAWYAIPGAPAAMLGARTLLALPPAAIDVALGVFFLCMIPLRRWHARSRRRMAPWHLAIAGALIGYITGIVLSTGPLSVPVFAAYGLVGGAFLSTEAASSMTLYISKVIAFRSFGAMPLDIFAKGLLVGTSLMVGTYAGKAVVTRISADVFRHLLDAVLLCAGLALIWSGIR